MPPVGPGIPCLCYSSTLLHLTVWLLFDWDWRMAFSKYLGHFSNLEIFCKKNVSKHVRPQCSDSNAYHHFMVCMLGGLGHKDVRGKKLISCMDENQNEAWSKRRSREIKKRRWEVGGSWALSAIGQNLPLNHRAHFQRPSMHDMWTCTPCWLHLGRIHFKPWCYEIISLPSC